MKKHSLALLTLLILLPSLHGQRFTDRHRPAMANPQVAYPITLHISGVHLRTECSGNCYNVVYVDAIMNGKKIELGGNAYYHPDREQVRFNPGDYKARILKDPNPKDGPILDQKYEVVLADGTIWPCAVTGFAE